MYTQNPKPMDPVQCYRSIASRQKHVRQDSHYLLNANQAHPSMLNASVYCVSVCLALIAIRTRFFEGQNEFLFLVVYLILDWHTLYGKI